MDIQQSRIFSKGFTLIELLVVIAILGVISSIVLFMVDDARIKGRDGARKTQSQELVKALEMYFSENGNYPDDGDVDVNAGDLLSTIDISFYGTSRYINRPPAEDDSRYFYCTDSTRKSMILAVDTEHDKGGTNWCKITRGPGPDYGCGAWIAANASDDCSVRFR